MRLYYILNSYEKINLKPILNKFDFGYIFNYPPILFIYLEKNEFNFLNNNFNWPFEIKIFKDFNTFKLLLEKHNIII